MTKLYKCGCCGEFIASDPVADGKRRYHAECLRNKDIKAKIRDFYINQICPTVVVTQLNSVIKNLIETKRVPPEFLLFTLKFIKRNNRRLNSPMGLHYFVNDGQIMEAYENSSAPKIDFGGVATEPNELAGFKPPARKNLADMLV